MQNLEGERVLTDTGDVDVGIALLAGRGLEQPTAGRSLTSSFVRAIIDSLSL
jgi:hypothetical protein